MNVPISPPLQIFFHQFNPSDMNEFKIFTGSRQTFLPLKSPKTQQFEEALLLLDVIKSPPLSRQSSPVLDLSSDQTAYEEDMNGSNLTEANPQSKPPSDKEIFLGASLLVQSKVKPVAKKRKSPYVARATTASGQQRKCKYCQATVTPMWRHGPVGYEDLCNKVFTYLTISAVSNG
jgi:hypothetical protein